MKMLNLTMSEYIYIKRTLEDVLECNGDDTLLEDVRESVEDALTILSNSDVVDEVIDNDVPPWGDDGSVR